MGQYVLVFTMLLLLAGAVIVAALGWSAPGGVAMGVHGWIALGLGVVLSIGLGAGLMALSFHSSRRGYDDRVDNPDSYLDHPE